MRHQVMLGCGHAGKIISGDRTSEYQCPSEAPNGTNGATFRTRLITECAEHLSAEAFADLAERRLDDYIESLWLKSLLAI